MRPILKQQEIRYDHPDSKWMFDPEADDVAVAITPGAKAIYNDYAYELLAILTDLAKRHHGLDRFQVFMSQDPGVEDLWVEEGQDPSFSICRQSIRWGGVPQLVVIFGNL